MAEEMKRRLQETLVNLTPKSRPVRRKVFAKKETAVTITELPEESEATNEQRLKRIGKLKLKKESKRAKIEVQEENKSCLVNQQDVEDLKLLEAVLSTKSEEEEESFDID